jgi:hypothetical protein
MTWKLWLQGLAAAAIGGAASGATQIIGSTGTVTKMTGAAAGVGAVFTVLAYLVKSPLSMPPAPPEAQK